MNDDQEVRSEWFSSVKSLYFLVIQGDFPDWMRMEGGPAARPPFKAPPPE